MRRVLLIALTLLAAAGAHAADRVALLIGNNAYAASPLRNAVNDARDLGDTLKELGFRVIVKTDATRKDMIDALKEFGTALEGANTALFFYAGHAMQFKERNYLIPIDAAMGSEEDITFFSVEVNQVFDRMDRAKTRFNFIVLDACRDNPFASSFKVSSAGLAQISAPAGTLIAYATSPGAVAQDGYGRNGVYTRFILQNIKVPDLPVEIMFKRVREAVSKETRLLQTPWDSSSLKGDFVFNASGRAPAAVAAGPSADIQLQIEGEFWKSVRESNRADDIQAYLDKYPNGNFAPLARNRLNALVRPAEAAPTQAASSSVPAGLPATAMPRDPNPEQTMTARSAPGPSVAARPVEKAVPQPVERPVEKPVVVAAAPASAPSPAPAVAAPPVPAPAIVAPPPSAPKKDEQPGREIAPGVREVVFADGSVYKGGMRGFVQHGKGEYISKAFQYQGEFKDGLKHGTGTYSWEGGDRYEGEFVDDRPNGNGKWRFSTGDTYEGEVKAGKIVGRGTYTTKGGDTFTGSFVDGKPHGVGVYRFASGDRYEGEMSAGVMNGKGRYITQSGDKIEAPFVAGRASGRGSYSFSNGDRYEGDIREGALTGTGVYSYATGQRYEGELRAGEPHGRGTYWFVDGTRFEGQFEGLAKASGTVVRPDGSKAPAEMVAGAVKWLN